MPQYINDFCSARQGGCQMPAVNIAGYQGFGGNVGLYPEVLNIQGQVNVTHVKGAHTLRFGIGQPQPRPQDLEPRQHVGRGELHQPLHARGRRHDGVPGRQPRALVGRVHDRRAAVVLDRRLRGARAPLAVFLGLRPGHVARQPEPDAQLRPPLRVRERHRRTGRRDIIGWDPDAVTAITALAEAAYAASPNPNRPASTFQVRGGPIFASDPRNERTLLEGGVAVDAASVGRLPARQPDGAQGRLRHVLRHAERGQSTRRSRPATARRPRA